MSMWLQTPIRQVEARLERRVRLLLRTLAWALDSGVPPADALRTLQPSHFIMGLQLLTGVVWLGGPLALLVSPMRRLNIAIMLMARDLRHDETLAQALDARLAPFIRGTWRVLLRRAETEGRLAATLTWLANQPGLCAPFYSAPLVLLLTYGLPLVISCLLMLLMWTFIMPNYEKMFTEMGAGPPVLFSVSNPLDGFLHALFEQVSLPLIAGLFLFLILAALIVFSNLTINACVTALLTPLPWLGRPFRWQCQGEAAQAVAWSLTHEPRLGPALELAEEGSTVNWCRRRLGLVREAVQRGEDWQTAWQAVGLVDVGDGWLLRQAQRLEAPGPALRTLAELLDARTRHTGLLRELAFRIALTLGHGLLVLGFAWWFFATLGNLISVVMAV